jgi:Tfp pilus assembly protein FimT
MMMKRQKNRIGGRRHRAGGFSLLEMITVCAILIILCSITFMSLIPALNAQHVTNAYNTTIAAMRQARDNAVAQRVTYSVTFSNGTTPNTIVVAPVLSAGSSSFQGEQSTATYQLPTDVFFLAQSQLASTSPPDSYGAGLLAIDFGYTANGGTGGASTVYFCPDGSAQDSEDGSGNCSGSWDGGVVYLARSGDLMSSRAVTLWGGTGRIHGWRFYSNGSGGYQWLRQ